MLSKTHITIGVATSLALSTIDSPSDCAVAIAGGALGGVIADVDILDDDYTHDAIVGELISFSLVAIVAALDYFLNWGITSSIFKNTIVPMIGLIGFVILYFVGFLNDHRKFTHSIFAMFLFSVCAGAIYLPFGLSFMYGYISHLLIDILNKRGIQLFFPLKFKICLKICYANKEGNTALMWIGFALTIILLIYRIVMLLLI